MQTEIILSPTELFDVRKHNREVFSCGITDLDRYLKQQARKEAEQNISQTFVLTSLNEPSRILAYYSLSSNRVQIDDLPKELSKRLPEYENVGVTLLGRFAVDEAYQYDQRPELHFGEHLLTDAKLKVWKASRVVASYAMIVDVLITEKGDPTNFYIRYDFLPFPDKSNQLYLPMTTIEKSLRKGNLIA